MLFKSRNAKDFWTLQEMGVLKDSPEDLTKLGSGITLILISSLQNAEISF